MQTTFDPRRRERRLGVDRRWSRQPREPDRRGGPVDRREGDRREAPAPGLRRWQRLMRRLFWNDRQAS